jgi:nitrite reductase/ring-hydroxylating ferredoxin subunit
MPTSATDERLSRRDFLSLAWQGALWATLGASLVALGRFLGFAQAEPPVTFTLDRPEAYPSGAFTPVAQGRAFIGRDERGLYAISATCTHLGCLVQNRNEGFECPCHASRFDASGAVVQGPAQEPLARAALTLDGEGRVVLSLAQAVGADFRLIFLKGIRRGGID